MASAGDLEERFQAAVKGIQRLPSSGSLQPSNLTKLIFYGLFKQATVGPCNESRPSLFNVVNRAKWDAWDRYRSLTKEEAMLAYIDEIRKVIRTMPISDEVSAFSKLIEPSSSSPGQQSTLAASANEPQRDGDRSRVLPASTANAVVPVSAGSSSSSSSISSSDVGEFYHDLSDGLSPDQYEMIGDAPGDQNQRAHSTRYTSSLRQQSPSTTSNTNYGRDTQRAILSALTNLQNDVHNILERLNRLETSAALLQQRELLLSSESKSSLRWLPLSGLHRRATAFVLIWPFFAFALIRLFLHAKIIIRFRQRRLL